MHKTRKILINKEECDIDLDIIPLIELLNSFSGVNTTFSCQGDIEYNIYKMLPYVAFQAKSDHFIVQVCQKVCQIIGKNRITFNEEILIDEHGSSKHFIIRPETVEIRDLFYENLKESSILPK